MRSPFHNASASVNDSATKYFASSARLQTFVSEISSRNLVRFVHFETRARVKCWLSIRHVFFCVSEKSIRVRTACRILHSAVKGNATGNYKRMKRIINELFTSNWQTETARVDALRDYFFTRVRREIRKRKRLRNDKRKLSRNRELSRDIIAISSSTRG